MGKKETRKDLIKRLYEEIEAQGERLKRLIAVFYPDGVRAEFAEAPQIGKTMMESPVARRFSEDEQARLKCLKIAEDAKEKGSTTSIEIDFFCTSSWYQHYFCVDYDACIMFKTAPEDIPIYVHEGFDEGIILRFLVDSKEKEAFLVLEDFDTRDNDNDFKGSNSSFIRLPEFHAIISGYPFNDDCDYNASEELCFMVSFSQTDGKCCVEKTYKSNIHLLDQLFPPDESNGEADKPATCLDSQPEATPEAPEQLTTDNDCNDTPPPKKRGRPAKNKSNVKVEVETETVIPSEPKPKASEMFELA